MEQEEEKMEIEEESKVEEEEEIKDNNIPNINFKDFYTKSIENDETNDKDYTDICFKIKSYKGDINTPYTDSYILYFIPYTKEGYHTLKIEQDKLAIKQLMFLEEDELDAVGFLQDFVSVGRYKFTCGTSFVNYTNLMQYLGDAGYLFKRLTYPLSRELWLEYGMDKEFLSYINRKYPLEQFLDHNKTKILYRYDENLNSDVVTMSLYV